MYYFYLFMVLEVLLIDYENSYNTQIRIKLFKIYKLVCSINWFSLACIRHSVQIDQSQNVISSIKLISWQPTLLKRFQAAIF